MKKLIFLSILLSFAQVYSRCGCSSKKDTCTSSSCSFSSTKGRPFTSPAIINDSLKFEDNSAETNALIHELINLKINILSLKEEELPRKSRKSFKGLKDLLKKLNMAAVAKLLRKNNLILKR
jgi:hypothetical protein